MPCLTPITLKHEIRDEVTVPCGKCPECAKRRASEWSYRLTKESQLHNIAHFVTLTYAPAQLKRSVNGLPTLNKRDCQLWLKRLRKHPDNKGIFIRYYLAGEYGGITKRPHYHAIIFGPSARSLQATWTLGSIHIGNVEGASIGYTLKYISKGRTVPAFDRDDREKEFSLMSKKMGLNYVTPQMVNWHNATNDRMFITIEDGRKISMPRYYKEKIFTDELKRATVGNEARTRALEIQAKIIEKLGLQEYERSKQASIYAAFLKAEKHKTFNQKL